MSSRSLFNRIPDLTFVETINLAPNSEWRVGLDDYIYVWPNYQRGSSERLIERRRSKNDFVTLPICLRNLNQLIWVDAESHLYISETPNIGAYLNVHNGEGEVLWGWQPNNPIHSFAYIIDDFGSLWFVLSGTSDKKVYHYHPSIVLEDYYLPKYDTVYGITVAHDSLYTIQTGLGHFVVRSEIETGSLVKMLGDTKNVDKGEMTEIWPIYYPEDIRLDKQERLWIAEMGRSCLTVLDAKLNIIFKFGKKRFGLRENQVFRPMQVGLGKNLLCIEYSEHDQNYLQCYDIN